MNIQIDLKYNCNCSVCNERLVKYARYERVPVYYNTETKKITCLKCHRKEEEQNIITTNTRLNDLHMEELKQAITDKNLDIEIRISKTFKRITLIINDEYGQEEFETDNILNAIHYVKNNL